MKDKCYTCENISKLTLSVGDLIKIVVPEMWPWNEKIGLIESFKMTEFGPQMEFQGIIDYFKNCKIVKLCPACHKEIKTFNFFKINVQEFIS